MPPASTVAKPKVSSVSSAVPGRGLGGDSNLSSPRTAIPGRPLSIIPNGALLRSLLITAVSSKPLLLTPTLRVLSLLSQSRSKFLFNVDRNPFLHYILRKAFYDHFCAGETAEETRACVEKLRAMGMRGVILTYGKETIFEHLPHHGDAGQLTQANVTNDEHIEDWRLGVMKTINMIGSGDYVALK